VFWVISVYFNIRNTLPKFCPFLLGHPVYTGLVVSSGFYVMCVLSLLFVFVYVVMFFLCIVFWVSSISGFDCFDFWCCGISIYGFLLSCGFVVAMWYLCCLFGECHLFLLSFFCVTVQVCSSFAV